ncbi:MAG: glycosyltransferase family 9 protein [Tissierellia bacterium]|jgi:heptosyltransferase-2|nr:glycosyltransferase family 9 protein [Tissierellia bacterium]
MLDEVTQYPLMHDGKQLGDVVLYKHVPRDYDNKNWASYLENPEYKRMGVKKILFYIGEIRLGDYIMINPTLAAFKKAFPDSEMYILGSPKPPVQKLIKEAFGGSTILWCPIVKHRLNTIPRYKRWKEYSDQVGGVDLLVDTQRRFLPSIALKFTTSYTWNIGYSAHCLFSNFKFQEPQRENVHDTFQSLMLARRLGISVTLPYHQISIPSFIEKKVKEWVSVFKNYVCLFPYIADKGGTKQWLREYFVELGLLLTANGFHVFLLGAPNQSKDLEKMAQEIGDKSMVATPSIVDIDEQEEIFFSAAILKNASLAISSDSGGAHFSAALGTPTLTIAPFTRLNRYAPFGSRSWVIGAQLPCSPCNPRKELVCKGERWCVKGVTPQIVFSASQYILSQKGKEVF